MITEYVMTPESIATPGGMSCLQGQNGIFSMIIHHSYYCLLYIRLEEGEDIFKALSKKEGGMLQQRTRLVSMTLHTYIYTCKTPFVINTILLLLFLPR